MIKLLVLDVDGTLTDGKIYMSAQGELMKAFNIKDGLVLARLVDHGVIPVILTGRESTITLRRCEELKITAVFQGIADKAGKIREIAAEFHCDLSEIAFMGDDVNDLACMKLCGVTSCPTDAVQAIRDIATYVSPIKGGDGAARDFVEWLIQRGQIAPEVAQ